jgi:hypothetical protein
MRIPLVSTAVVIPIYNNYSHLRNIEKSEEKPPSFDAISNHILFISYSAGAMTFVALAWLWTAALAAK